MVKIFKILFMLFLFPLSVWAQETEGVFKGIVTNTEGIGIANVLCKALKCHGFFTGLWYHPKQRTISFAIQEECK